MSWTPSLLAIETEDDEELPVWLPRTDGVALIYKGRTHSIAGESESGKTWLALELVRQYFEANPEANWIRQHKTRTGGDMVPDESAGKWPAVMYMDFDSDRNTLTRRLKLLGAGRSDMAQRFFYLDATKETPDNVDDEFVNRLVQARVIEGQWVAGVKQPDRWVSPIKLVVIDNVTAAIGTMGYGGSNEQVARWLADLPNKLAARGVTVLMIDHLTKANDGTGRYPIGAAAKLNAVSGAQYIVDVEVPLKPGAIGQVEVRVGKDRSGYVREHSIDYRPYDRTERAAALIVDGTDRGRVTVTLKPPTARRQAATERAQEALDERLLQYLKDNDEANLRALVANVCSDKPTLYAAIDRLKTANKITERPGPRNQRLFSVAIESVY